MQKLIQKLQSRKFWVALATIVTGILMMFGYAETSAETIAGAILSVGGAVGYMIAEGVIDAASAKSLIDASDIIITEVKEHVKE